RASSSAVARPIFLPPPEMKALCRVAIAGTSRFAVSRPCHGDEQPAALGPPAEGIRTSGSATRPARCRSMNALGGDVLRPIGLSEEHVDRLLQGFELGLFGVQFLQLLGMPGEHLCAPRAELSLHTLDVVRCQLVPHGASFYAV